MKNISTGTGLCVLGLAVAIYPILDRVAPVDRAAQAAVTAATSPARVDGPPEPTIVWYGVAPPGTVCGVTGLFRAWSDGRLELTHVGTPCQPQVAAPWMVVSAPNQGYSAAADVNFDAQVDGADLGIVLAAWGDAPRHDVPPSVCPLNLINP